MEIYLDADRGKIAGFSRAYHCPRNAVVHDLPTLALRVSIDYIYHLRLLPVSMVRILVFAYSNDDSIPENNHIS